jgi:hypothetical protein
MHEHETDPPKPPPATSEAIPLAVEFLINLMLRWFCLILAGAFGLLALAAWVEAWAWWVVLPALALTLVSFACAFSFRPRGKIVVDRVGPSVIVPDRNPPNPG